MPQSKEQKAIADKQRYERKKQEREDAKLKEAAERDDMLKSLDGEITDVLEKIKTAGGAYTLDDVEALLKIADPKSREVAEAVIENNAKAIYIKSACWAFIVYPDSAPTDWRLRLEQLGHCVAISPLHDKDLQTDGTPKKPHYHVILYREGGAGYTTARYVSKNICNGTLPIPLASPRGYYRYFCHLDNPNKARYDEKDIVRINGFDVANFLDLTRNEVAEIEKRLLAVCREKKIFEYCDLIDYVIYFGSAEEYEVASTHTVYLGKVLDGRRCKLLTKAKRLQEYGGDKGDELESIYEALDAFSIERELADRELAEMREMMPIQDEQFAEGFEVDPETGEIVE